MGNNTLTNKVFIFSVWFILFAYYVGLLHMTGMSWRYMLYHPWHALVYMPLEMLKAALG
jgi:hypothetical protein